MNRHAASVPSIILLTLALSLIFAASCSRPPDPAAVWAAHMQDALAASGARKFEQAERHYKSALAVAETFGPRDVRLATTLHDYAEVCRDLEKEDAAESMHRRALEIRRAVLGPKHRDTAQSLTDLSTLCSEHGGRLGEAESLLKEAIPIWEVVLAPDHPILAYNLDNLAVICTKQRKFAEAQPLFDRAIAIWKKGHPESQTVDLAWGYQNYAYFWEKQDKFDQAEALYIQALPLFEKAFGPQDFQVAAVLNRLAAVNALTGRYGAADTYYQRAITILEKSPGHVDFRSSVIRDYADLLDATGKETAAKQLRDRIVNQGKQN